ncbi:MAG: signal peptide peptidase SppA, partial [bacterium]|nr:signal peptide peptidase SppA [bacterium]
TFLKNTLSKLGIQAEMFHIGKYKTAANMFTEDRMTTAHEESLGKLLEDIFNYTLKQIAVNRKLEPDTVKAVFDKSPVLNDAYLEAGLIDHIGYEDEMYDELPSSRRISFHIYKQTKKPRPYRGSSKIAVIFASGEIHSGKSGGTSLFGGDIMGSDTVARQLRAVRRNRFVKAVVLRVDSPGGSSAASEVIRREAELLAKEKPLVISMSGLAASGGYWISMASPNIMALPQTITGSIGVVTGKFVLKGLYDKVGISKDIIKTSKYADIFSDYRVFNEDEKIKINKMMQSIYQTFLETVSTNRKMTVEDVDKLARGRIWSGSTAKELKLVDKLGGLDDAIEEAKRLAVIPPGKRVGIKIYPRKKSFMDYIFDLTGTKAKVAEVSAVSDPIQVLEKKIAMYKNFFPALMVPYKLTVK